MKAGLYKCTHCGHITRRDSQGRSPSGAEMWFRCEKCQFDTLYHKSWWLHGLGIVMGEGEKSLELKRQFDEAEATIPLPPGQKKAKCPSCGHEWVTKSKSAYVTCPSCLKKVKP